MSASLHDNVYTFADRAARSQHGQAARLPRDARQGGGVESGEIADLAARHSQPSQAARLRETQSRCSDSHVESGEIATRDATYRKEAGALPPALPPSLVATIAGCPRIRIDNRDVYLLGRVGIAWRDAIGWRWAAHIGGPSHDIWNTAFTAALDERAGQR